MLGKIQIQNFVCVPFFNKSKPIKFGNITFIVQGHCYRGPIGPLIVMASGTNRALGAKALFQHIQRPLPRSARERRGACNDIARTCKEIGRRARATDQLQALPFANPVLTGVRMIRKASF